MTSFTGPKSGLGGTNDVIVWTPPQYNDPAYANTDFPVVLLFPGYPGTPQTWFGNMAGQKELGTLVQQHASTPFVLVAVNISPIKGVNTDCTDIPGGPQVATFITDDVRTMIERTFRVTTDRSGWGMMGYSEGGLCAGKLLVQYPQLFSAAVQMSGDVRPGGYVAKYGSAFANQNSTLWLLQNHKPSLPVALLAAASAEDAHGSVLSDALSLQAVGPEHGGRAEEGPRLAQHRGVEAVAAAGFRLAEPAPGAGAPAVLSDRHTSQRLRRPARGRSAAGLQVQPGSAARGVLVACPPSSGQPRPVMCRL